MLSFSYKFFLSFLLAIAITKAQDNCLTTQHDGFCTSCPPNYGQDYPYNYTCIPCGDLCSNCRHKTSDSPASFVPYCITCNTSLSSNSLGPLPDTVNCTACADPNCNSCLDDYQKCTSCKTGYGLDPAGPNANFIVCKPCNSVDAKCLDCETLGNCTSCPASNPLYEGKCYDQKYCETLNGENFCQTCKTNAGFVLPDNKTCQACGGLCESCILESSSFFSGSCLNCSSGVSKLGKVDAYANCSTCEDPLCTKCDSNYEKCDECPVNYGLTPNPLLNKTDCLLCSVKHPLCWDCTYDNNCTECDARVNAIFIDSICRVQKNCQVQDATKRCETCNTGFGLVDANNFTCEACSDTNCTRCNSDYKVCEECNTGFKLSGGACSNCEDPNCVRCQTSNCEQCATGYGLDPARTALDKIVCKPCNTSDTYCQECAIEGTCTKCDPTMAGLVASKCEARDNCATFTNNNLCSTCKANFGLLFPNRYTCVACGDLCSSCQVDGMSPLNGTCTTCQASSSPIGKVSGAPNCTDCDADSDKCVTCKTGYGLDPARTASDKIVCKPCADPNCVNCAANYQTCVSCADTYGLDVSLPANTQIVCKQCGSLCNTCIHSGSSSVCTQCSNSTTSLGRVLSTTSCSACLDGNCKDCFTDHTKCSSCITAYGLDPQRTSQDTIVCKLCSAVDTHCLDCEVQGTCTFCNEQVSKLNNGICQETLSTNFEQIQDDNSVLSKPENLLAIILGTVIPLLSLLALILLCCIWPVGSGGFLVRMRKITQDPKGFTSDQA